MAKIAVIGGGISGLAAAHRLQEMKEAGENIEARLFEQSDRLGGVIAADERDGFRIEGGPDCFVSTKPWAIEMADKLGISDQLISTNEADKGTLILSRGRLHPMPEGVMTMVPTMIMPLAKSRLFSWRGKLRMGLEYFIPAKKDAGADESLASFVGRRLGRECLDRLAEPLIGGIHAGDPETMSIQASFGHFLTMEQKYGSLIKGMLAGKKAPRPPAKPGARRFSFFTSFKGCMPQLTKAVIDSLKDIELVTNKGVAAVAKEGNGYKVSFRDGSAENFDSVIVTTPAYAVSEMLQGLDSELAAGFGAINYATSATINLAYNVEDLGSKPKGFGFLVPLVEDRKVMAATFSSNKWNGRAPEGKVLIRCFVGGAHNQKLVDKEDAELVEIARAELADLFGIKAEPLFSRVFKWYKSMPQYTVGHRGRVDAIMDKLEKEHPGLYVIGGAYYGVGIGDCIHNGWTAADKAHDHTVNAVNEEVYEQTDETDESEELLTDA